MRKLLLTMPVLAAFAFGAPLAAAGSEITAFGKERKATLVSGPDADGAYTLQVNIADLDVASEAGWRTMARRVEVGTWKLCDAAGAEPEYHGYHNPVQRDCWRDTRATARLQMGQARDAARSGTRIAMIGLSR